MSAFVFGFVGVNFTDKCIFKMPSIVLEGMTKISGPSFSAALQLDFQVLSLIFMFPSTVGRQPCMS